ncbi:MAG: trimeric autotransporter adhesin [Acidobacteriota bacterium]|nr:trimeric autotransporter adhesin [Acidobacteriota bacterium]
MKRALPISLVVLFAAHAALADVALVERRALQQHLEKHARESEAWRQRRAASAGDLHFVADKGLGAIGLADAASFKWFLDTNTTSNAENASGAVFDAFYATSNQTFSGNANVPVEASTSGGGAFSMPLSDAFDGYNGLCIGGPCGKGGVAYTHRGSPKAECGGRQYAFNPQTVGSLTVSRKFFVPANDTFARWLDVVTNTGAAPQTVTLATANNLGSDTLAVNHLGTRIDTSSSGDATVDVTDNWVTTYQGFDNQRRSSDPRLGHVFQGPGRRVGLSAIHFAADDDAPTWEYAFTLNPGQTAILMNFATGQPRRSLAQAKAAELTALSDNSLQCLTPQEMAQVVNFAIPADLSLTKSTNTPSMTTGGTVRYTLTVTNHGPSQATSVKVTDTLPAGMTFVSAAGTGWACSRAASVVTCTRPALDPGAGPSIALQVTVRSGTKTLVNQATVSGATADPSGGNNAGSASVAILPAGAAIPTLSELGLAMLALLLFAAGLPSLRRGRA